MQEHRAHGRGLGGIARRLIAALPAMLLGTLACVSARAGPAVVIIIDDLGHSGRLGIQTAELPGPVACAVLPGTPHGSRIAERCHAEGKAVMLHMPMQPSGSRAALHPTTLTLGTAREDFARLLDRSLAEIPHVVGVNNHMGSLLTRHITSMVWLMEELRTRPELFYVDSRTTPVSVAHQVALSRGVPSVSRDVFLDNEPTEKAIRAQFSKGLAIAGRRGQVVMIGHPYPRTLAVLDELLPTLESRGFTLMHVADMMRLQATGEETWPAYSYPLQTAVKK